MARAYVMSPYTIGQYYNICGEEFNGEVARKLEERGAADYNGANFLAESIASISPFYAKPAFFESTILIDNYMQDIMEKVSEMGGSEDEDSIKKRYSQAIFRILKTATSLNLLPEGNEDYMFHYARLDIVILEVLRALNNMTVEETIKLYELIESNNAVEIYKEPDSKLINLIVLAMCGDDASHDYDMFVKNSVLLNDKKLAGMAAKSIKTNQCPSFEIYEGPFKRLSFQKTKSLVENK